VTVALYPGSFDPARRIELIERSTAHLPNVRVIGHEGLTVDAARTVRADAVVRAMIRAITSELTMAATNEALAGVETFFVTPHPEVATISSTLVRALLAAEQFDQIADLVPPVVLEALAEAHR
jgi:pantetheine-phosphate adenylyltransferase